MPKKVIVGMSGGIDSSVAALLLKKQGFDVVGVSIKHLSDELSNSKNKTCCSLDDINDARIVCYSIGIPHYVINVEKEFKQEIVREFIQSYQKGITPNPCVICNEKIKIKTLLDLAKELNFDYVATGHYAVKTEDGFLEYVDYVKDQSYMLYRLKKSDLDMMIFPLASMQKSKVRQIARENNIITHDKKDSTGICFAQDGYIPFLEKNLDIKPGNFIDENGNFLGKHKGYQLYTVGQRRHLGLKLPYPIFVLKILPETNEIVLGEYEKLMIDTIQITNYIFHVPVESLIGKILFAQPRFSSKGFYGKLMLIDEKVYFKYDERNAQNANGQHIVLYDNKKLIGGGVING